ncbi:unnamed protein product [Dovyalis caffra]|uniref:Uncharacterized protein n=1 Tax=Dovyalis caffra TaxID=77055 RepID=A0AAV1S768_9ROSI|nr:unnamed protein product [Dovyalis caffra]
MGFVSGAKRGFSVAIQGDSASWVFMVALLMGFSENVVFVPNLSSGGTKTGKDGLFQSPKPVVKEKQSQIVDDNRMKAQKMKMIDSSASQVMRV